MDRMRSKTINFTAKLHHQKPFGPFGCYSWPQFRLQQQRETSKFLTSLEHMVRVRIWFSWVVFTKIGRCRGSRTAKERPAASAGSFGAVGGGRGCERHPLRVLHTCAAHWGDLVAVYMLLCRSALWPPLIRSVLTYRYLRCLGNAR